MSARCRTRNYASGVAPGNSYAFEAIFRRFARKNNGNVALSMGNTTSGGVKGMTLQEVKEILNAQVIIAPQDLRMEVKMACGCDLMSDVLAFTKEESLLLTGLTNLQVVRTAEMANIKALVFVRGKEPDREAIALAMDKKIPVLLTDLPMYEACGRLYQRGLPGCSEVD